MVFRVALMTLFSLFSFAAQADRDVAMAMERVAVKRLVVAQSLFDDEQTFKETSFRTLKNAYEDLARRTQGLLNTRTDTPRRAELISAVERYRIKLNQKVDLVNAERAAAQKRQEAEARQQLEQRKQQRKQEEIARKRAQAEAKKRAAQRKAAAAKQALEQRKQQESARKRAQQKADAAKRAQKKRASTEQAQQTAPRVDQSSAMRLYKSYSYGTSVAVLEKQTGVMNCSLESTIALCLPNDSFVGIPVFTVLGFEPWGLDSATVRIESASVKQLEKVVVALLGRFIPFTTLQQGEEAEIIKADYDDKPAMAAQIMDLPWNNGFQVSFLPRKSDELKDAPIRVVQISYKDSHLYIEFKMPLLSNKNQEKRANLRRRRLDSELRNEDF